MSNSTAVAATIGVGALGVLAYYGYQNLGGKTEDVQVGVLYNDINNNNNEKKSEEKDLQTQAKEEVAKVVENATNAWSGFWKNEYNDLNSTEDTVVENTVVEDEATTADVPKKSTAERTADSSDFN
ncbi:MAG: hypothetical protein ACXADW_04050 [Candidatus Hodarchaeales archaeon]|jgi:hypothetical protein